MTPWIDDNFYAIDVNVCEHLWTIEDLHDGLMEVQ